MVGQSLKSTGGGVRGSVNIVRGCMVKGRVDRMDCLDDRDDLMYGLNDRYGVDDRVDCLDYDRSWVNHVCPHFTVMRRPSRDNGGYIASSSSGQHTSENDLRNILRVSYESRHTQTE